MSSKPEKLIEQLSSSAVMQLKKLAEKFSSVPLEPTAPSLDDTNAVAETRHIADRAWFLTNPTLWSERQQKVVAVFDQTVLGEGVDFGTAYEAARKRCASLAITCPDQYDLTFVVVPDVVEPEPAPDWNPQESTKT